jgi:GxxExxY protein
MPIRCRIPLRRYTQQEFGELSYEVLHEVFAIHNQMGRFFDEKIYKAGLAARRDDVLLEEPIEVTFRSFTKQYFLDVLVAGGGLFEFKAVERLIARHRTQLLNYLLLTGLKHGMLINVRPEKVEREFVNAALTWEDRFAFVPDLTAWNDEVPGAAFVRELVLDLLGEWGTGLELSLYEEAIVHFLGGESHVIRPVGVLLDSVQLGEQPFRHAADDVAFKLTAFEQPEPQNRFRSTSVGW